MARVSGAAIPIEPLLVVLLGLVAAAHSPRRQWPGVALIVVGASLELVAWHVGAMAAGGLAILLGSIALGGLRRSALPVVATSVALFVVGAGFLSLKLHTGSIRLMRFGMPVLPPTVSRGALLTVWIALAIRLVILPPVLVRAPSAGILVGAFWPAWCSSAILAQRWGGVLSQDLVEACGALTSPVAGVAAAAGVWAFSSRSWRESLAAVAAGGGALAAAGWSDAGFTLVSTKVLLFTIAVGGVALSSCDGLPGSLRPLVWVARLLVLGLPLGGGFAARMRLLGSMGGLQTPLGMALCCWWLLPLVSCLRGVSWERDDVVEGRGRPWVALGLGTWAALQGGPLGGTFLRW